MNSETTATPVHRGLFADLRDRLAQRPDTEHQAALIRIVIALIAGCYLLITVYRTDSLFSDVQWHVIALVCFFIPFSIGIFISILVGPQISVARRILSMFMDIAATTYALYFLDAAGTAVFGVYLFNACGNGFRFGPKYLYLSSALSIVGFTFVLATSEYWASHLTLGIGLLLVLLVIPMYFASLSRQLHDALARMHTMATHDTLTGLPNRHSFYEQLQQTLKLAERSGSSFAVVFIDLDGFKPINDSLGHAAGDEVLKSVARRLKQSVRSDDVVARIGGDEFVIILSIIEATGLLPVVRKIINIIATPYTVSGKTITLTSSTGVATYPDSGRTVDELVACADTAMYRSKRNGRNCFCLD
jgi:diguanylate cyclase (GGDEF)-like protein